MRPRTDGLEPLRDIRRNDRELPSIMLSGASPPLKVVEAMKSGATDFIPKPVSHEDLCDAIEKALGSGALNGHGKAPVMEPPAVHVDGGNNVAVRVKAIEPLLRQIGSSERRVFIHGVTG